MITKHSKHCICLECTAEEAVQNAQKPSSLAPAAGSATRPLTLTIEEIRHLALLCGLVVAEPSEMDKEDERETEIAIAPWAAKGMQGDDGMLPPHRYIAYFDEYPEEGCVPLGSPNAEVSDRRPPAANPETKVNRGGGSLD